MMPRLSGGREEPWSGSDGPNTLEEESDRGVMIENPVELAEPEIRAWAPDRDPAKAETEGRPARKIYNLKRGVSPSTGWSVS